MSQFKKSIVDGIIKHADIKDAQKWRELKEMSNNVKNSLTIIFCAEPECDKIDVYKDVENNKIFLKDELIALRKTCSIHGVPPLLCKEHALLNYHKDGIIWCCCPPRN